MSLLFGVFLAVGPCQTIGHAGTFFLNMAKRWYVNMRIFVIANWIEIEKELLSERIWKHFVKIKLQSVLSAQPRYIKTKGYLTGKCFLFASKIEPR